MIKDFEIKKRLPNIILGTLLGILSMQLGQTTWAYLCFAFSVLALTFADRVIKHYVLFAESRKFFVKGHDVNMEVRDKDGKVINRSN